MKMRRVLALVMAVLMVIGLMPVVAADNVTPPTDVQQGKVTFTKDLRRDANRQPVVDEKGWYTVDISVSGVPYTVTEKTAADVVLIVDNSGSMAEETGHACDSTSFTKETYYDSWDIFELNPKTRYVCDSCGREYYDHKPPQKCRGTITRIDAAKEVSKIFADDILDNTGNKMAVIGFSSGDFSSSAIDSYQSLTSVKSDVSKAIDKMSADGGTDYTAAFKKGMGELLNEDGTLKNNRPAYVIFISDGAPGLYRDEPKLDDPNWNGSAQITALKAAGVKIYTIGIKLDGKADDYMSKIATDIKHYVNVQTKNYDSEMEKVLVEWAEHINSVPAGKNAVVTDYININDFDVQGINYDNNGKITWNIGDIPENGKEAVLTFSVRPKDELKNGTYYTNVAVNDETITTDKSCILSYTSGKTEEPETKYVYQSSPTITLTDHEEKTYTVTYEYKSGTEGAELPADAIAQLPHDDTKYAKDADVIIAEKPDDVTFFNYTWKFLRWEINGEEVAAGSIQKMVEGGLEIVGIWTRTSSLDEEYHVTYKFESGTEGAVLPWNVNEQLPVNNSTYSIGQEVTVAAKPNDVVFGEYTWKFQGWKLGETDITPNSKVPMVEGGLEFVGIWIRTSLQDEEYSVTYKYDENVPSDVKETLPTNPYKYKVGENVTTARPNPDVVEVEGYRWTFKAWQFKDAEVPSNTQILMEKGGLTFVGIWTSEIITPEPPEIMAMVTVKCVNE